MLNVKGRLFVAAMSILMGGVIVGLGLLLSFFTAQEFSSDNIRRASVETGDWISTCSGGVVRGACEDGVLEVTFADGSRTHVVWGLGDVIEETIVVESRNGGSWVVEGSFSEGSPALVATLVMITASVLGLMLGGLAGVAAYEYAPSWGRRRYRRGVVHESAARYSSAF